MHKKIETVCGKSEIIPDFASIGNNPNFVFENDQNFETIRLFDIEGNVVNVNSWLECANYVNGGWTNSVADFYNGERLFFFGLVLFIFVGAILQKKFNFLRKL